MTSKCLRTCDHEPYMKVLCEKKNVRVYTKSQSFSKQTSTFPRNTFLRDRISCVFDLFFFF